MEKETSSLMHELLLGGRRSGKATIIKHIKDNYIEKEKLQKHFKYVEGLRENVNILFKRSIAHTKEFELYSDSYDILTDILDSLKKLKGIQK